MDIVVVARRLSRRVNRQVGWRKVVRRCIIHRRVNRRLAVDMVVVVVVVARRLSRSVNR